MRALIPNTAFLDPKTKDIHPAWRAFLTQLAQFVRWGDTLPEGNESAPPGTLYLYTTGGANVTLWAKETGQEKVGWVAR